MTADDRGEQAYQAIYVNGHANGSLMVRMARTEERLGAVDETLVEIKDILSEMADDAKTATNRLLKTFALWLTICTLLFAILDFLAPSIKKALNITADASQTTIGQTATNPPSEVHRDNR